MMNFTPFDSVGLRYSMDEGLVVLDQRQLPHHEVWEKCETPERMAELIHCLAVRGAPLIGVAAALCLAETARQGANRERLLQAARLLRAARPTAVNLMIAVDRVVLSHAASDADLSPESVQTRAREFADEDVRMCERMGKLGAELIADGDGVLTHCNAGALATAGIGTAVGVIISAHRQGKRIHVYVDETRPLLQGARLTAWELGREGVPYTLICDNMSASLMRAGKIQKIFVGADRIAANGDFANKIGTYGVAVLAKHHGIPFYAVAPRTTMDPGCPDGAGIPIEQRAPDEVRVPHGPRDAQVYNPAFDVTPAALVTAHVFDDEIRRFHP